MTRASFTRSFAAPIATVCLAFALAGATAAQAQISLQTAVDLALTHSPRVKMAGDDIAKAQATLAETKSVYIPAINLGGGYGDSFGYSNNLPTFFAFQTQSLIFNYSQLDYIRAARSGIDAASLSLREARTAVVEETALAFVALQRDQQREAVLITQNADAQRLVGIVQDRFDAGRDTRLELHTARLTAAQLHLRLVSAADDTYQDRVTLGLLTGIAPGSITAAPTLPPLPALSENDFAPTQSPGIEAAYAQARAKQQTAWGDRRYLYRPQISFIFQYNRYATFTDSFKQIEKAYGQQIGANQEDYAVLFNFPVFDRTRQAKARESAADAAHALHEAQSLQLTYNEGQSKLSHSLELLRARMEVAVEERALAQDQLEATTAQMAEPSSSSSQPVTPKDEQNARIGERDKYLNVVDSEYSLLQAEIRLLRQTGGLETWVRRPAEATRSPVPISTVEPVTAPNSQP